MSEESSDTHQSGPNDAPRRRPRQDGVPDMRKQALSAASGITDDALLERLVGAGIGSDTLTALSLVPLVAVAWADGSIDGEERAALLAAAIASGLDRAGPGHRLLTEWLAVPPPADLVEAWTEAIRLRAASLDTDGRQGLKLHLLGRARRIAEAAGDLLGHASRISAAEEAVLARLKGAFQP